MQQVKRMGPLQNVLGMLPGMPKEIRNAGIDDREIARVEAIIRSMTPDERRRPEIINGSRRSRIARGSGVTTSEVNGLLKQFKQVQQMMKGMPGVARRMNRGKKGKKGKAPRMPIGGGIPGFPQL
jgi:signal recognition particle subunit SRP54